MITLEKFNDKIRPYGLVAESKNEGYQFYIKCPAGVLNFYPKREKWCNEKGKFSQGINQFLAYVEANKKRLLRKPMRLEEYLCYQALAFTFSNLTQVEDYGFKTWEELYDHIIENDLEVLLDVNGEEMYVVEAYEHLNLVDTLEQLYDDFRYILQGVNEFNVDLKGV